MEVGSGGHGGLGGGLEGDPSGGGAGVGGGGVGGGGGEGATDGMQEAMVAAARDRAIRAGSVRQDLALDLPPRLQLPDGEERPYGAHTALHLRDPEQVSPFMEYSTLPNYFGSRESAERARCTFLSTPSMTPGPDHFELRETRG